MKSNSNKKLYLIDGAAYIFRAYYGFGTDLTSAKGFPTKAIFGFKNMIRTLLERNKPEYLVMVFDPKGDSFRKKIYPAYKANRSEAPEDLKKQFEPIFELVDLLQMPTICREGWEADDVIASLSRQFAEEVKEIVIVSGDKDLTQLVNNTVSVYDSMKNIKLRREEVKNKFGIYPEQVAEYLSLTGDSSDNIPGAKGIGPKTATDLLSQYKNLENIFQNLEQLKPAVCSKLEESKENIALSLKLTELNHFIELDYNLEDFQLKPIKQEELRNFYYEYSFAQDSLLKQNSGDFDADLKTSDLKIENKRANYKLINNTDILQQYLVQIEEKKIFAFDLETTSLIIQEAEIVGIAIAVEGLAAAYIPLAHLENKPQLELNETLEAFAKIFANPDICLIAHNLKYEISVLKNYNIILKNQLEDTMLQSYLINADANRHNLDRLALVYLNHTNISFEEVAGKKKEQISFDQIAIDKALPYAAEDAEITLKLFKIFNQKIKKLELEKLYRKVELPLALLLSEMERKGVKIDSQSLTDLSKEIKIVCEKLAQEIYQIANEEFNLNSPKQLGEVLFEKMGIQEFKKKTKTGYSTDSSVLTKLAKKHPIASKIEIFRGNQKLINTYLDVLPQLVHHSTGRIHTSYNQTVAATGRLSSTDPNLQNIPIRGKEGPRIRASFIASRDCYLISADYSQIELRLLAHFCEDKNLIQAFKQDKDIHTETAASIFQVKQTEVNPDKRAVAKAINFGLLYGMGATKLSEEIGSSRKEAQQFMETYFSRYPKIKQFIEISKEEARKKEFVTTILGRRRAVKGINDKNPMMKAAMERIAVNTIIQGSAADIIKLAMLKIAEYYQQNHQMIMQIHDELVFEVPQKEAEDRILLIKEKMENAYPLKVILKVDIQKGTDWRQAH